MDGRGVADGLTDEYRGLKVGATPRAGAVLKDEVGSLAD